MLRVNPGVEAHTHEYLRTGGIDSKFGVGISTGEAAELVERMSRSPHLHLKGVHVHVGSQVFEVDSFRGMVGAVADFVRWVDPEEVSFGGGLGVAYVAGEIAPSIGEWGEAILTAARQAGIEARILAEPGRAIVARSAVTLYTVGTIKEVPGVRTYVSVDGGMSDNPRPVLYGSGYEVFLPRRVTALRDLGVRLVGKHCESGDVLVRNGRVPSDLVEGDIIATPVTGAYGYAMGSNYNLVPRPAVVFVADGEARLVLRRETLDDMMARDVVLEADAGAMAEASILFRPRA
jgi:diaminopimelate decarboxylase